MAWVRVDDGFPDHPKLAALEDDPILWAKAVALWQSGLCYASRTNSDGEIARSRVVRLVPFKDALKVADALVECRLWEDHGAYFLVHDYLRYNASREERAVATAAKTERQRGWRKRKSVDARVDARVDAHVDGRVDAAVDPAVDAHVDASTTASVDATPARATRARIPVPYPRTTKAPLSPQPPVGGQGGPSRESQQQAKERRALELGLQSVNANDGPDRLMQVAYDVTRSVLRLRNPAFEGVKTRVARAMLARTNELRGAWGGEPLRIDGLDPPEQSPPADFAPVPDAPGGA